MPCRVPKRRFSCGAPQHLTKNLLKRVSFGLRNFERFRNRILYINTRNETGHALSSVHVLSRSA